MSAVAGTVRPDGPVALPRHAHGPCPPNRFRRSGISGLGTCTAISAFIARVTWSGGVTKPGGDEIDAAEVKLCRVMLRRGDGALVTVTPVALGDLQEDDDNQEPCLDVAGLAPNVSFPGGALTDPNEDLNPATAIDVSPTRSDRGRSSNRRGGSP